jgi:hypothetical protein
LWKAGLGPIFSLPDARRTHFTIAKAQPARLYSASGMNERYIRWWTPHMSRDFEMLVFGDARGLPLILFPTSFGRYDQNKDFGLIDACAPFVDSGKSRFTAPTRPTSTVFITIKSIRLIACGRTTLMSV